MDTFNYSIIIPHKNTPKILQRCLDSIPRRNDIQVIVVDDNSDPNIVDFNHFPSMNDNHIEIIYTKEGKGAGYARNVGLKHAKGKWLLFADADDFYTPNAWNVFDDYLNTDNDIIYFCIDCVDSDTLNKTTRNLKNNFVIKNYIEKKRDSERYLRYTCWEPWNKLFRHNFVKKHKLSFEEIIKGNDAMFVIQAGHLASQITAIPNNLYTVTYRKNSLSFTLDKKHIDSIFALKIRMNKFYKSINLPSLQVSVWYEIKQIYNLYGIKEAINYIKYARIQDVNLCYLLLSDWKGILRFIKKQINKTLSRNQK